MNTEYPLRFHLKGQRRYVQGPDIHDALCDALAGAGSLTKLDLVFHRMALTQLKAVLLEPGAIAEGEHHVVLRCLLDGQPRVVLADETGEAIASRVEYDEDRLVSAMRFDLEAKTAALEPPLEGYTNCEMVVSLNKALLTRALPEARGKWLFTRLQLDQSMRARKFGRLEIAFLGHSNYRLTRTRILGDGETLGHVFFSLQPAE